MTAEVVVMNKSAIALAADSTVTIEVPSHERKTYNTVNKLFALSKYHPVGVMIYGNASLMGVPWETVIKEFRRELKEQSFPRLEEYAQNLVRYIEKSRDLFPKEQQEIQFENDVKAYFMHIKDLIASSVEEYTKDGKKITESKIKELCDQVIETQFERSKNADRLEYLPKNFGSQLVQDCGDRITAARKEVFEKFKLSAASIQRLRTSVGNIYSRKLFPQSLSGVVVAGFGDNEPFPSLKALSCHCIVRNRLIFRDDGSVAVTFDQNAVLVPFAQSDVVETFLRGVDPRYAQLIDGYLTTLFGEFPDLVAKHVKTKDKKELDDLLDKLRKDSSDSLQRCRDGLNSHLQRKHINPLTNVISVLPIDELAAMAGSLVHLTTSKRKMSFEMETVGGPVDVAVISKGDGFIWIDRKHYFRPDLNPRFMQTYLQH